MIDLIALDVGNTRVTAARMRGDDVVEREAFRHETGLEALQRFLARQSGPLPVALVAVRPEAVSRVLACVPPGWPVLRAPEDFQAPVGNACDPPQSVGQDRLFNAAGATAVPCVLVDAGTAITVDLVDGERVFRGGAIAPGVALSLRALHRDTGLLPLVHAAPGEAVPARGTDTAGALRCGVVRGLAGLVERLVLDVGGGVDRVVLTGGDAELLQPLLPHGVHVDRDLMLRGIARGVAARAETRP